MSPPTPAIPKVIFDGFPLLKIINPTDLLAEVETK